MVRNSKAFFLLFFIFLFVTACATTSRTGGVYHSVKKGETLWRIARAYNCDPDEIARANNLTDSTIEAGSALFIPNATQPIDIDAAAEAETSGKRSTHTVREETLGPTPTDGPSSTAAPEDKTPVRKSYRPRFIWPAEGTVSSKFGTYKGMRHNGIKIDGKEGTPILAAAAGTVTFSAPMKYFGETIIIKHSGIYSTVYSQLKERTVSAGNTVKQGEQIGLMGTEENGKSRLSFEVRRKNRAKNPLYYLPKRN